jgi:hypothetical protein
MHQPGLEVAALVTVQLHRDTEAAKSVTRTSATVDASWSGMAYTSGHFVK